MVALQDRVKMVTAERDQESGELEALRKQHDALRSAHEEMSARLVGEIEAAREAASKQVTLELAASGVQQLALTKELEFVKDLAQVAESEKRAAQQQVLGLERQIAGMRFDAETRIQELEKQASASLRTEAVAEARARDLEAELSAARRQAEMQEVHRKRVEESLRSVLAINESLLARISAIDRSPADAATLSGKMAGNDASSSASGHGAADIAWSNVQRSHLEGRDGSGLEGRYRRPLRADTRGGLWAGTSADTVGALPGCDVAERLVEHCLRTGGLPSGLLPSEFGRLRQVVSIPGSRPGGSAATAMKAGGGAASADADATRRSTKAATPTDSGDADRPPTLAGASACSAPLLTEDGEQSTHEMPWLPQPLDAPLPRVAALFSDLMWTGATLPDPPPSSASTKPPHTVPHHMIAPMTRRGCSFERPTLASAEREHALRTELAQAYFDFRPPPHGPFLAGRSAARPAWGSRTVRSVSAAPAFRPCGNSAGGLAGGLSASQSNTSGSRAGRGRSERRALAVGRRQLVARQRFLAESVAAPIDYDAMAQSPGVGSVQDGGNGRAAVQISEVIRSVEHELEELNLSYQRSVATLRLPTATEDEDASVQIRLRDLVLSMESKGAQLAALRRSHAMLSQPFVELRGSSTRPAHRSAEAPAVELASTASWVGQSQGHGRSCAVEPS